MGSEERWWKGVGSGVFIFLSLSYIAERKEAKKAGTMLRSHLMDAIIYLMHPTICLTISLIFMKADGQTDYGQTGRQVG